MASLRDTVKDYQEELRDGIAWVAFWKRGRSWNAEYFHLEMGDYLYPEDRSRMEEIKQADPAAVVVNGYYSGYLGEDTFDEYFKRETAETVFEKAGKKITPKLLLEAIRTLPEEKRKAILLYYFEGMSDTEIAELLNTPRSTIQYRRTSSFEQLRKYLEENADEWDEW